MGSLTSIKVPGRSLQCGASPSRKGKHWGIAARSSPWGAARPAGGIAARCIMPPGGGGFPDRETWSQCLCQRGRAIGVWGVGGLPLPNRPQAKQRSLSPKKNTGLPPTGPSQALCLHHSLPRGPPPPTHPPTHTHTHNTNSKEPL
jgi:hypothetical protein